MTNRRSTSFTSRSPTPPTTTTRTTTRAMSPVDWSVGAVVLTCACAGRAWARWDDRRGATASLGAPAAAMLAGACAAAFGWLPSDGSGGTREMQAMVASVATPMMLFGANLRETFGETRRLATPFACGACGTAVGAFVGALAFVKGSGGSSIVSWKLAAALAAKNIGGGVNYVAVATALGMSREEFVAGVAADNVFALMYFPFVSFLARRYSVREIEPGDDHRRAVDDRRRAVDERGAGTSSDVDALTATFVSVVLLAAGQTLAAILDRPTATIPIATALTVALATAFPRRFRPLAAVAEPLAAGLLFVFFVVAGASGAAAFTDLSRCLDVFLFLVILYAFHLTFILVPAFTVASEDRRRDFLLASNACVGGPATAAALCESAKWRDLYAPGVLIGTLGNAIATFAGLGLAFVCRSLVVS